MTTGSGRRPFGLSLDPLEGESLAGFALRLAHRLHISPHELARLTGLTAQDRLGRARASLSTRLTPAEIKNFAVTTRLDPREVRAMTLEPLASRYPPPMGPRRRQRPGLSNVYSMHADRWLFPTTARYCPRCLAGDGSDIQHAHGGPWQILWRLPVVFACPLHEVFLEHLCPRCQKPVNFSNRAQLFPPSRCRRSPPCPLPDFHRSGHPDQSARHPLRGTACPRPTAPSPARARPAHAPAQDPSPTPARRSETAKHSSTSPSSSCSPTWS